MKARAWTSLQSMFRHDSRIRRTGRSTPTSPPIFAHSKPRASPALSMSRPQSSCNLAMRVAMLKVASTCCQSRFAMADAVVTIALLFLVLMFLFLFLLFDVADCRQSKWRLRGLAKLLRSSCVTGAGSPLPAPGFRSQPPVDRHSVPPKGEQDKVNRRNSLTTSGLHPLERVGVMRVVTSCGDHPTGGGRIFICVRILVYEGL